MKHQDFINAGVRNDCIEEGIQAVRCAAKNGRFHGITPKKLIKDIVENPNFFFDDDHFGIFAKKIVSEAPPEIQPLENPISYKIWGENIEPQAIEQMNNACRLPDAKKAALNADAHFCHFVPVGSVIALEDAICPMAIGNDISCKMHLSVIDYPIADLEKELKGSMRKGDRLSEAILNGTRFGTGGTWQYKHNHDVMDMDWNITKITKAMKDKAWSQLGTSGDSNHFVDIGIIKFEEKTELNVDIGEYVAILSHSGSRGAGSSVYNEYNSLAKNYVGKKCQTHPYLSMKSQEGIEYWNAMNLMKEYAKGNHDVIHRNITKLLGCEILATVHNEHNLAWKENVDGKELYVHRKGATPAHLGLLGIIPGSQSDPCFVVRGKGNPDSINSASHGAGRRMSRTQAKKTFTTTQWKSVLKEKGVRLLAGGIDEFSGAYKDIRQVMEYQKDLVDIIAEFQPRIVRMANDRR